MAKPSVLLTNDDGPPDSKESPYVLGLYYHLSVELGWDVKVVLPSSQKSWIGKAFHIKEITKGSYYYLSRDGQAEVCDRPRPLKPNEVAEWILLDGTPATCANVALHNLYPGQIDLVVSGPNLGRNTSAAFALSSGTIGAALSASLSKTRSIALSYGTVLHPTPKALFKPAHSLASKIIQHLWDNWGLDSGGLRNGEVDLYNVNIPLVEGLLTDEGLKICWTTMWRNTYSRLFRRMLSGSSESVPPSDASNIPALGGKPSGPSTHNSNEQLLFQFSPDMKDLVQPPLSSLPVGSDSWAIHRGLVSVTPLRASFGVPVPEHEEVEEQLWRL